MAAIWRGDAVVDLVTARSPFIDGAFVRGDGPLLTVESPATTEAIAAVETASTAQFDAAIAAARRAFDDGPWPRMAPAERIAAVRRFADALEARRSSLVETVIQEAGCPRMITELAQVGMAMSSLRELCDLYERLPEWEHNEVPLGDHVVGSTVRVSIRRFEPSGVVAAISPCNFPFITNVWKVVPALLVGCTVVLRPNPLTPLQAMVFGQAADEAGLPAGVLNIVVEEDSAGALRLTTDPRVDTVTFTGSTTVGRLVAAQGAPTLKRVILELGGKSAAMHLPDVFSGGVDSVVAATMPVFLGHAGQGCALQTRVLVPEKYRQEVADGIADTAAGLTVGDPSDYGTLVGPLISSAQRRRVDDLVQQSVAAGARLVSGGRAPEHCKRGWFYQPTVLDAPDPRNPANQHEFFGPVVSVLGYRDVDDAVAIVNSTEYGLSAGIYTNDLPAGLQLANRIRSGTVQINTVLTSGYAPMGGYKQSGYGRERGTPGLRAFQEIKHIVVGNR